MKKLLLAFTLIAGLNAVAQDKYLPEVKQGSRLSYIALSQGQETPILISVDSLAPAFIKLGWSIEGLGSGGWIMKEASLQRSKRGWWNEPASGTDLEIPDDQAVLLISKSQWENIQKNKKAEYEMEEFQVKEAAEADQLKLNGKVVDAILLGSADGNTRLWILNNPSFPVLLKTEGNKVGIDIELREIN